MEKEEVASTLGERVPTCPSVEGGRREGGRPLADFTVKRKPSGTKEAGSIPAVPIKNKTQTRRAGEEEGYKREAG